MNRQFWLLRGLRFALVAALFIAAAVFFTRYLWNWLVPELFHGPVIGPGQTLGLLLADLLPAPDDSPENRLLRETLMEALTEALAELPAAQRQVFVWHELEDKSFREMEAETGVPLKTLISRKHYAVLHLRKRLQKLYTELFTD